MKRYNELLYRSRPVSEKHPPMPLYGRAAQFAAFAALSGYEDCIEETARLTDGRLEPDEDRAAELDMKTHILIENASLLPEITLEYFVPDKMKEGGAYYRVKGNFRRFDWEHYAFVMADGKVIAAEDIYSIEGEIFSEKKVTAY